MIEDIEGNQDKALTGHLRTHFDVMNKELPLEYIERKAVMFDVSKVIGRDIDTKNIDLDEVKENMFVAFHTGFIEKETYGGEKYFTAHPQL